MCLDSFISVAVHIGAKIFVPHNPVRIEGRYMSIPYSYHGMDYVIYVPFSRILRRRMINTKTFLVSENGEEKEISQQPGCCYLVTASVLSGKAIKIIDLDANEEFIFEKDEIPVFPKKENS